jgi:hypothetical protein
MCRAVKRELSRFQETRLHIPDSSTAPGHVDIRAVVPLCVAFRQQNGARG